jgi:predicted nuclease with TOPRIM domain
MSSPKEENSFLSTNYQQNFVIVTSQTNFSLNSITNKWFQYSDRPTMTKILCSSLLSLSLFTLGCLTSNDAIAQTKVLAKPDSLTITGIRGAATKETRNLTLRSTDPINNIRIYTFDLYNSDRDRVFPKSLITVPSQVKLVNNESLETFPVEFNLQNSPSGEFQGEILISYDGSEVSVPVIVRVKDPWYLPFTLLVFGVLLGTTVSSYSRSGRIADEIAVSIESLRTQLKSDTDIPPSFASRISTHLIDAEFAKDAKQIDSAQKSVSEARNFWNKWIRQRVDWLEALKVGNILKDNLTKLPIQDAQTLYIQAIQKDLTNILLTIADIPNPSELGQKINQLSQQQRSYLSVQEQLRSLQKGMEKFKLTNTEQSDRDKLQALKEQVTKLNHQLGDLLPSNQEENTELKAITTEINQAFDTFKTLDNNNKVEKDLPTFNLPELEIAESKSVKDLATEVPVLSVPEIPSPQTDDNFILKVIAILIRNPSQRLQIFSIAGYLTTIAFFAGTGFNQLYLESPTFGANGIKDYFALIAWGFGAEATRSAITNAIRKTDTPKS